MISLLAVAVFCGLLLLIGGACIYFAKHQSSHTSRYGSWSQVLDPRSPSSGVGPTLDINENLRKGISARRGQRRRQK